MKNLFTPEENMIISNEWKIQKIKKEIERLKKKAEILRDKEINGKTVDERDEASTEYKYTKGMIWAYENTIELLRDMD